MASIDYQEARKEIIRMFTTDDGNDRKVIFWYDALSNFKDDIAADSYDCCRVLVCDRNEFEIKKIIEHDDPASNFLVYIPSAKPVDTENWLLDMLMYGNEYYADTVALTMRRLGLTNSDLRRVVERHSKFFDADGRIKKLSSFVSVNDKTDLDEMRTGMMCVLAKAASRSIESVLTELVFDDVNGSKYAELKKFGFEEYLWDQIAGYYNYDGDQKIEALAKRFFFTALLEQKAEFDSLPSFYDQYTIMGPGRMDAKFFIDKIKTDRRYEDLQLSMADELKIEGLLASRDVSCVQTADVFECIDNHIIEKIAESLVNESLDYETFERVISNRINSIWYEKHEAEYNLLSSAMAFFKKLQKPIETGLSVNDYVQKYAEEYYLIDTYYRRICTNFKKMDYPIEAMEKLLDRVENSYQNDFLEPLGKEYSDALAAQGSWNFPGINMSDNFYKRMQRNNYKKCFVIISDGFRYEIGRELYEKIKSEPILKGTDSMEYMISPIPSETRFGMASLLPHQSTGYANKSVLDDSQMTNSTAARNAILQSKNASYAAITYDDINSMARADLRTYMADKSLVYVYHDVIDNMGEHNEARVFDVAGTAVDEILGLIKKLYNSLQISNFYVTADHGFLYRRKEIEESAKYRNVSSLETLETSRRYVITNDPSMGIPYTTEFTLDKVTPAGTRVITPYGYDLFCIRGGGLQYVHGGASLQETIVPVIHIGELSSAKNKESVTPVGVRLKSVTRKITNRSFSLEFEQYEKVEERKQAITCVAYLVDEDNNIVSGEYKFIAASESDDMETRTTRIRFNLMNIEFDRNKRYFLILKNAAKPDEYMEREQFTIDILQFKML